MLPSDSSIYIPLNNALLSRLKIYVFPLMLLLLTRVGLLLIGLSAPHLFSAREVEGAWRVAAMPAWLEMWARWDSGFYLEIAKYGYTYNPTEQTSAAFFPLYPLLIKLLSFMTTDPVLAGFIVSNTCFYIALIILYKLTLMDFSKVVANRTLIYLALFPTSFFFSAVYTESIFLMLILLAVYAGRKQRWELAGIAGLLASFEPYCWCSSVGCISSRVDVATWLDAKHMLESFSLAKLVVWLKDRWIEFSGHLYDSLWLTKLCSFSQSLFC